jgi:hypothetical protein
VARLVRCRLTEVVLAAVPPRRPWHRLPVDHDPVEVLLRLRQTRKVRPTEIRAGRRRVEVQRVPAAAAKRLLHLALRARAGPGVVPRGVVGPRGRGQLEREARRSAPVEPGKRRVQDVHLRVDDRVRDVPDAAGVDDVEVHRHHRPDRRATLALGAGGKLLLHLVEGRLAQVDAAGGRAGGAERVEPVEDRCLTALRFMRVRPGGRRRNRGRRVQADGQRGEYDRASSGTSLA